jgi:hypothetical protein
MQSQILSKLKTTSKPQRKNQCNNCLWFAAWADLEIRIIATDEQEPQFTYYVHRGPCENFQKPNTTNRARPRCPECHHGNPAGHAGRACPTMVPWHGPEHIEYDTCDCRYNNQSAKSLN